MWPDWAIFSTLGNHSKPVPTIILPKSPTLLGNFCKGVKIIHFSSEIIFRETFIDFWRFLFGHTAVSHLNYIPIFLIVFIYWMFTRKLVHVWEYDLCTYMHVCACRYTVRWIWYGYKCGKMICALHVSIQSKIRMICVHVSIHCKENKYELFFNWLWHLT